MIPLLVLLIFILGSSIGSYIAGRSFRIIHNEDTDSFGRSHCPSCHHTLAWYDLLPILSYLSLQGKCRYCKKEFSNSYFFIELTLGVLFVLGTVFPTSIFSVLTLDNTTSLLVACTKVLISWIGLSLVLYISVIDLKLKAFPITGLMIGTGIIAAIKFLLSTITQDPLYITASLGAAGTYLLFFMCIKYIGSLVYKKEVLGDGDLYLVFFLGMLLGFRASIVSFYIAIIVGGIWGTYLLLGKKMARQTSIAFGPLLALGCIGAIFFSDPVIAWYSTLLGL